MQLPQTGWPKSHFTLRAVFKEASQLRRNLLIFFQDTSARPASFRSHSGRLTSNMFFCSGYQASNLSCLNVGSKSLVRGRKQ